MSGAIGILGGTFDPVHNGHLVLATTAAEILRLERLLVVPARESPHKAGHEAAPPEARLELLRLAFRGLPGIEVSDVELRRPPPSYTVDTLDELARRHAGGRFILLLGVDALAAFPRWRDAARIARQARIAAFAREGHDERIVDDVRRAVPGLEIERLATPRIGISATWVRERVGKGLPVAGFVPESVAAAIAAMGLYRG
jgi:nicotinate-nucleotide adenylyltransferase